MARFRLSKWYLDCVTDSGDVSIAYAGKATWGLLRLHYASLLESRQDRIEERRSLRAYDEPIINGDSLSWSARSLGVWGSWESDSIGLREIIFQNAEGSIEWECLIPRAKARIQGRTGLGYAEKLTMTIPPWKLPIETLRWGRLTSSTGWAVWIDWRGEVLRRIVYLNGRAVPAAVLNDEKIAFEGGEVLTMDRSLVLRNGALGKTVLSKIPGLKKAFPARLLEMHECKWRSRATLKLSNGAALEGWAIHEVVRWPK